MRDNPQTFIPEKLFGIIGDPLGHSLSPALHNQAFAWCELPYVYCSWPLKAEAVEAFVQALRLLPISGCSVTIPHKTRVAALCDGVSDWAVRTGAVNTLYWKNGELFGENTDCPGFMAPLQDRDLCLSSALVLGSGGAALAVLAGLQALGVTEIAVAGRNPDQLRRLEEHFAITPVAWEDRSEVHASLLVNATPLGMAGDHAGAVPYPGEGLSRFGCVYDLVYNPLWTELLGRAKEAGCISISGLDMFVRQAVEQFRLWTGRNLSADVAKHWVQRHLDSAFPRG